MHKRKIDIITVFLPLILLATYFFFVAEDRYISSSTFTLKAESEAGLGVDLGFLGAPSTSKQDQMIIKNHILSQDMMEKLISEFTVEGALSNSKYDPLWKISENNNSVDKFKRYKNIISITYDEESGVSTIKVENFNPSLAKSINEFLLSESINFVNEFSNSLSNAFIDFAEKDLARARENVSKSLTKLNEFQRNNRLLTPETETESVMSQLTNLEMELSQEEINYQDLTGYMQETSPQVKASKRKIETIKSQITKLENQITDKDSISLDDKFREYTEIKGELDFAKEIYETALKTVEASRIKAMQSQKHIMTIASPNLPDSAELPKRFFDFITWTIILLLMNLSLRLTVKLFKEYE